jgi:hypothetical protein
MHAHTPSQRNLSRRDLLKWSGVGVAAAATAPAVWSPARAQTPKRGGTLSLRLWDPPHFDPHLTISYKTHIVYSFTHSRLLKHKAGPGVAPGTFPIEGDLAESWTQPNETTFVFNDQRHLAKQQYYVQLASAIQIAVWESALKNYGPNVSYDYGGRLQAAWLDR